MKKIVLNLLVFSLLASSLYASGEYEQKSSSYKKKDEKEKSKKKKKWWGKEESQEQREKRELEKEMERKESASHKKHHQSKREKEEERRRKRKKQLRDIERREHKRLAEMKADHHERRELAARWKDFRQVEDRHDHELGRYADLYKQPARPTYATIITPTYNPSSSKWMFNPSVEYDYAVDGYLSSGGRANITKLAFGENDVQIQDLLLVSKLAAAGQVLPNDGIASNAVAPNYNVFPGNGVEYLSGLATQTVRFLGKAEGWTLNLDLARFIFGRNIVFGVQMPVVYKHNQLRAQMDQASTLAIVIPGGYTPSVVATSDTDAFLARYGQNTDKFIEDIMRAKGITELGGSSTGLGDITVFAYAAIEEPRLDHLLVGLRFLVPTAQKATQAKLWAPELGNGGYIEGTIYSSIGMYRNWYINPHLFLQATFSGYAHVNKRVPKIVTLSNLPNGGQGTPGTPMAAPVVPAGAPSFAARVTTATAAPAIPFVSAFDTTLTNLADNVTNFKIYKGPEFNVRVGNMFEEFIFRRAFLDIFYDFRAKLADGVGGLTNDIWNIDIYKNNTQQIEHKAGLEWSYQFEESTRLQIGVDYTFAGRNVPKLFAARCIVTYAF